MMGRPATGRSLCAMASLVPTIDISCFDDDVDQRSRVAAQVAAACRDVGFLEIAGHGVPQDLIDEMQAVTTEFFDLPLDEKSRYVTPPVVNRGYSPPGAEAQSYSEGVVTPPDMFQAFNATASSHVDPPITLPARFAALHHDDVWPERPTRMRAVWETYVAAVTALAHRVLRSMAVALQLDERFFVDQSAHDGGLLRAIDYRRAPDAPPPSDGQMRLGAHTDYGLVTLLYADPLPGLQIHVDGAWHDVVPNPGCFVVNLGDLMAVWTNDRWRSTLHRVVPADLGDARARRSLAFFHGVDPTVTVEPLASCVDADHPARYEPVAAGDHLLGKIASARSMRPAETIQTTADRRDALRR